LLDKYDIRAATDITGFGLAGHLLEMLRAADLAAEIDLAAVPLLAGTAELLKEGLESTLAPENRAAEAEMNIPESVRRQSTFAALFDPQTCGGLLVAVRPESCAQLLGDFIAAGDAAALVGTIEPHNGGRRLRLRLS
jgi:selenide,water dikinase